MDQSASTMYQVDKTSLVGQFPVPYFAVGFVRLGQYSPTVMECAHSARNNKKWAAKSPG